MTLYEMKQAAINLYEMLQADEIDEQAYNDTMEGIGADEKLEDYIYVITQYEADNVAIKTEIDRLKANKEKNDKAIERMKKAVVDFMNATGQKKANAGTFKLSLRKSESTLITDETKIPSEYLVPQPPKVDKTAIKKAIKLGIKVDGAVIEIKESVVAR